MATIIGPDGVRVTGGRPQSEPVHLLAGDAEYGDGAAACGWGPAPGGALSTATLRELVTCPACLALGRP